MSGHSSYDSHVVGKDHVDVDENVDVNVDVDEARAWAHDCCDDGVEVEEGG